MGGRTVFIVRGGWGFSDFYGKVIVVYGNSGGGGEHSERYQSHLAESDPDLGAPSITILESFQ